MNGVRHQDVAWGVLAKLVVAASALLVVIYLANELAPLGGQIVVASFVAVALDTVARHLEVRGMRRGHAVLTVLLGVLAVSVFVALIVIGPLVSGAGALADRAPDIVRDIEQSTAWSTLSDSLNLGDAVLDAVKDAFAGLPGALVDAVLALVGSISSTSRS